MRVLVFHGYLLRGTGSNVYNAPALARAGPRVEDEDPHRPGALSRLRRMPGSQRYRLGTPSTGREIVIEAEPRQAYYTDRETGEEIEVVGLVLPLAPSRLEACRGPWRTCASATGATSSPSAISTTAPPAGGAWRRSASSERLYPPLHMRTYVVVLFAVACLGLERLRQRRHSPMTSCRPPCPSSPPPPGAEALAQTSTGTSDHVERHHLDRPDRHDVHRPDPDPEPVVAGAPRRRPSARRRGQSGTGGTSTGTTGGTRSGGTPAGPPPGAARTGGVSPGEFSQFCKDNPGAC